MSIKPTIEIKRKRSVGNVIENLPAYLAGPIKVKVGFPAGEVGGDIVSRAVWNEFGTSRGIPERPFMRNSLRANLDKYVEFLRAATEEIIKGGISLRETLEMLGTSAAGDIQTEISSGDFAPNAPSTIKRKGSSRPLIDTGQMRASVTYKVEN